MLTASKQFVLAQLHAVVTGENGAIAIRQGTGTRFRGQVRPVAGRLLGPQQHGFGGVEMGNTQKFCPITQTAGDRAKGGKQRCQGQEQARWQGPHPHRPAQQMTQHLGLLPWRYRGTGASHRQHRTGAVGVCQALRHVRRQILLGYGFTGCLCAVAEYKKRLAVPDPLNLA